MTGPLRHPPALTFGRLLGANAATRGSRPALTFEGTRLSWAQLDAAASRWAKALIASGIGRGDMVAIHCANRPEWLFLAMGCARIGAILAPLNTFHLDAEIVQQLRHSCPRLLFTVDRILHRTYGEMWLRILPELAGPGAAAFGALPSLERVIALRGEGLPGAVPAGRWLAAGEAVPDGVLAEAEGRVVPDDDLYVLYTSGSTGVPKGVRLTHGGTIGNTFQLGERQGLTEEDCTWIATPLFYGLATINAIPAIWSHGGSILLQEVFEPGSALEVIERDRPTTYVSLANMSRALYQHPDRPKRDLSSLKKGIAGFSTDDMRIVIEGLGVTHCCAMYGLTETYGNCFITDWRDSFEVRTTSSGHVVPGWEYRLRDEDGKPVAPGETGLLEVRGRVTPGYLRNDAANAEAFCGDGFFRTGDLVRIDADGRLHFHGRKKEILKVAGVNVSPAEIEKVIDSHPDVAECHITGVPDETRGELIVAFVDPGRAALTGADIIEHVRANAARYKVPSHVFLMRKEDLPRLGSGKVPKYRLTELAKRLLAEGQGDRVA
ncbi:MAG: acyl--CoA ligase [Rhodobacteraceae bacterium]|nr:acyl--CoA ligase [Paracoccaceae bacterium]